MTNEPKSNQYGIWHLLFMTLGLAVVFALGRLAGAYASFAVVACLYAFAPWLAAPVSRMGSTRMIRYVIATAFLIVLMLVAMIYSRTSAEPDVASNVIFASTILWGPQIAILYMLRAARNAGLRSAGVHLNTSRK
ncbi:hypothetical protein Pla22_42580 [Rubripirellula amarantea]|uniref:Uncharacterized protein n=1 Tax=Rubripirellula amarantea TaxID=2527999 RepID=A0A5C5WLC1_9BACT|nr:hypothetical protein Pla22_42580 [Rubripirellula amarantea]